MGFSSIVGAMVFLFIFAGMAAFAIQATKNIAAATQQEGKAAAANRAQAGMELELESLTYAVGPTVAWTDDAYADFQGTVTNSVLRSPGTVTLVGPTHTLDGTYQSQIIDTGSANTNYTTLSWTSIEPALTDVSFQIRSGASPATVNASTFTGPDGTASTYYGTSGSAVFSSISGAQYVQYRAYLDSNDTGATPQLQSVSLGVVRDTGVLTIRVTNSGTQKLILNQTDVYISGVRVPRYTSRKTFDKSELTDQVLWLPGQTLGIAVFGTLTPPQPISVANADATAAGTVS